MYRIEDVADSKSFPRRCEQHHWMQNAGAKQCVASPVVNSKDVEAMMGPVSPRTVAHRDQRAYEQVQRGQADCHQADIGGKINGGYWDRRTPIRLRSGQAPVHDV